MICEGKRKIEDDSVCDGDTEFRGDDTLFARTRCITGSFFVDWLMQPLPVMSTDYVDCPTDNHGHATSVS